MSNFKPDGYPSLSPYLIAADAAATIRFLEQAFGGTVLRRYDHDDGSLMHAEVRIDDSVVMLGGAGTDWPAVTSDLHLYVPDVDATYRAALAAGGESIQEPVQKRADDDRRGGVKGPSGNRWWMATQPS